MNSTMTATESEHLVRDFLQSWQKRDLEYIMSFFSEESVYHNVPVEPIRGLDGIRRIFSAFLDTFSEASLDVVSIVASPGHVIAERIDRFTTRDGKKVVLPVTGVFVLKNRTIVRFSDYFDLASFETQAGMKL